MPTRLPSNHRADSDVEEGAVEQYEWPIDGRNSGIVSAFLAAHPICSQSACCSVFAPRSGQGARNHAVTSHGHQDDDHHGCSSPCRYRGRNDADDSRIQKQFDWPSPKSIYCDKRRKQGDRSQRHQWLDTAARRAFRAW